MFLLPPAYVVRREGNSFTLLVCPHLGGYPYPIMLCNISQNAMGQPPGGYPARSSWGGTLPWGTLMGGTLVGGILWWGYPAWGVPCWGVPRSGTPPGQVRMGGTQLGQHREYLLHGGRYASCVHAGRLSCYYCCRFSILTKLVQTVTQRTRKIQPSETNHTLNITMVISVRKSFVGRYFQTGRNKRCSSPLY